MNANGVAMPTVTSGFGFFLQHVVQDSTAIFGFPSGSWHWALSFHMTGLVAFMTYNGAICYRQDVGRIRPRVGLQTLSIVCDTREQLLLDQWR